MCLSSLRLSRQQCEHIVLDLPLIFPWRLNPDSNASVNAYKDINKAWPLKNLAMCIHVRSSERDGTGLVWNSIESTSHVKLAIVSQILITTSGNMKRMVYTFPD